MPRLPVSPFLNQSAISYIDGVVAPATPVLLSQALESVSNTNEQTMLPVQNNQGNSLDQTFSVLPTTSAAAEEGLPLLSTEELETILLSIDHLSVSNTNEQTMLPMQNNQGNSPDQTFSVLPTTSAAAEEGLPTLSAEELDTILLSIDHFSFSTTPVLFSQALESVSNANEQTMLPTQNNQGNGIDKTFSVLPTTSAATEEDLSIVSTEEWEALQELVFSDMSDQDETKAAAVASSSKDKELKRLPVKDQSGSCSRREKLLQAGRQLLAKLKEDTSPVPHIVKVLRVWKSNVSLSSNQSVSFRVFAKIFNLRSQDLLSYIEPATRKIRPMGQLLLNQFEKNFSTIEERKLMAQFACTDHGVLGFLKAWQSNQKLPENKRVSFERFSEILAISRNQLTPYIDRRTYAFKDLALRVLHQAEFPNKVINILQAWQSNLQRPESQRIKLMQFAEIYRIEYFTLLSYIEPTGDFNEMGLDILQKATTKEKERTSLSVANEIERGKQTINKNDALEQIAEPLFTSEEWAEIESSIMMLDIESQQEASVEQIMRPMQNNQSNSIDRTFLGAPTTSAAHAQKNAGNDFPELRKLLVDKAPIIKPQDDYLYSMEDDLLERYKRDHSALPAISKILKIWQINQHRQEGKRVKLERFAEIFKIDLRRLISYINKDTGDFRTLGLEMLQRSRIIHSKEEDILVKQFSRAEYKIRGFLQAWESNQQFPENRRVSYTRFASLLGITITELSQYIDRETRQFKELGLKILHRRY